MNGPEVSFEDIKELVSKHERFAVFAHMRPDGDAIGSQVALGDTLTALGKKVRVINEDPVPESLAFLPLMDRLELADGKAPGAEVAFVLDTGNEKRLGQRAVASVGKVPITVNLDHHVSNDLYGDMNYVDAESPATGQILYQLIEACQWPLSLGAAENLYAAISTDTGSFQYPGTTAETYRIASALVSRGVNVGSVNQSLYESYPYRRIELMRELLNVLKLSPDGRIASWVVTRGMINRLKIKPEDGEGLIDIIRAIDSVVVAVVFEELPDGKIRVSSRSKSKDVNVSLICQKFKGGGHALAAGARIAGSAAEVEKRFLKEIDEAFSRID